MSNDIINDDASASTEEVESILEDGQSTDSGEAQAQTPQEELDFFDYTEVGDKYVKLQVDGEEVSVPIKEALAGYQRQRIKTHNT